MSRSQRFRQQDLVMTAEQGATVGGTCEFRSWTPGTWRKRGSRHQRLACLRRRGGKKTCLIGQAQWLIDGKEIR